MSASQALIAAAGDALRTIAGLTGVHEAMPVQAALPYVTIEAGLESDWGHKAGLGASCACPSFFAMAASARIGCARSVRRRRRRSKRSTRGSPAGGWSPSSLYAR